MNKEEASKQLSIWRSELETIYQRSRGSVYGMTFDMEARADELARAIHALIEKWGPL